MGERLTREDVQERFCKLQATVMHGVIGYGSAADCFCGRGGFWNVTGYTDADYRNEGEALEWIEKVVADAISAHCANNGSGVTAGEGVDNG